MLPEKKQRDKQVNNQPYLNQLLTNDNTDVSEASSPDGQLKLLNDRIAELNAAYTYINANYAALQGTFTLGVKQVLQNLSDAIGRLKAAATNIQKLADRRAEFATRVLLDPSKTHQAGDGTCYVNFVNVGMGDCTIVTSPHGKRIMIDCGSDSTSDVILDPDLEPGLFTPEDFIEGSIQADTFLNGQPKIDLLFLTHPDTDHHNKLQPILKPLKVKFTAVYFGGNDRFDSYGNTKTYLGVAAGTGPSVIRKVDLRENPAADDGKVITMINNVAVTATTGEAGELGHEFMDARGALVVYYEDDPKSDFRISLLAGNASGVWKNGKFLKAETDLKRASEKRIPSNDRNRRCLVVLIECFGRTVLVCGDATVTTEIFQVKHLAAPLGTVQYLRMGHHGSTTSSCADYLGALTSLDTAIASTGGMKTTVHNLPKQLVLGDYLPKTQSDADTEAHSIYAFKAGDKLSRQYILGTKQNLFATGSNDSLPKAFEQS